jgi:uncharacterized ferritin-like protein (DUF455 family)
MDWSPFRLCPASERPPSPRSINTPQGVGDRLRTAAFAELQAREAFLWAAEKFGVEEWRGLSAEEGKHLGWLLARMSQLAVDPAERPVSDGLWRSLTACASLRDFAGYMLTAEERGRDAEVSFSRSLAASDPVTAAIFRKIAEEEEEHLALGRRLLAR